MRDMFGIFKNLPIIFEHSRILRKYGILIKFKNLRILKINNRSLFINTRDTNR